MGQEDEPAVPPKTHACPHPPFLLSHQVSNSPPKPGSYNRRDLTAIPLFHR